MWKPSLPQLKHPATVERVAGHTTPTREVYNTCMAKSRTNIELDDEYVERIMNRYRLRTKTEAVDMALRHLAGLPMSREEALAMRGARAIDDVPVDEAPRTIG